MGQPLINTQEWVTLLGGGQVIPKTLKECLKFAPCLIAADGAGDTALALGEIPEAVIGDFDSLSAQARSVIPEERLHAIPEQDSTDFEKCLTRINAPLILAHGFTGERIDHALAALYVITKYPDKRCIIVGDQDVCAHVPRALALDLALGTRVSLFPMGPVTGRSTGLRWPIAGLSFAPNMRVGTSNEASAPRVTLTFDGPGMLVLLPRAELWNLAKALLSEDVA